VNLEPDEEDIINIHHQYLNAFNLWMKQAGFTESTKKEYAREVKSFLLFIDGMDLRHMKKMFVVSYLVQEKEKVSETTRNRSLAALRSFFKAMIDFEFVDHNPALDVKKSKTERNIMPVYLESEKLSKTMNYVTGKYRERNMAILLLMAYCGLRVGEVHRLNLNHYNEEKSTITVLGKGRKWNEIPLAPEVNEYMKAVQAVRITPYRKTDDAFFTSQKGRRLSIRQIQKMISQLFEAMKDDYSELKELKLSCHKLRHSFATLMLRNQVDIRIVKELLGHTSIETTMIYTHINDDDKKQAMATINIPLPANLKIFS